MEPIPVQPAHVLGKGRSARGAKPSFRLLHASRPHRPPASTCCCFGFFFLFPFFLPMEIESFGQRFSSLSSTSSKMKGRRARELPSHSGGRI